MIWTKKNILQVALPLVLFLLGGVFLLSAVGSVFFHSNQGTKENLHPVHVYSSADPSLVTVDISGAIQHPGLYRVIASHRIADVIALAGGFTSRADFSYIAQKLDLAKKIRDEEKIYIPFKGERWSQVNQEEGSSGLISINTATSDQLNQLPGISKKRAEQIIQRRPYATFAEFQQKTQLSRKIFQNIESSLSL